MTIVPIYNRSGEQVSEIVIDANLTHVSGRVSLSDKGHYYKGVGVPYRSHAVVNPGPDVNIIGKDPVFYCGYTCENPNWKGKAGIFQDRYQPYFSDFIGSCGPKELRLIEHSRQFDRSSVRVLDCVDYDKENNQRYFILDYECKRRRYLDGGDPKELGDLIDYMVLNGWNFPWDKAAIRDISFDGRVSDVADMFRSKDPIHRFGTVYSILYSLATLDFKKYTEFVRSVKLKHSGDIDFPMLALALLDKNGVDVNLLLPKKATDNFMVYEYLVGKKLIYGTNCAHVESKAYGDKVIQGYVEHFAKRAA